jgi:hypothetical protein
MSEPTYILDQAREEPAHQECRADGHDLTLLDTRTFGGDHAPISVRCDRCERHWSIGPGNGGINLGETTREAEDT